MELERSAARAQARGGIAAVAAFLERASDLTQDPARRSQRALKAAQAKFQAGAFEPAAALLATATAGQPDELTRARIDVLHAAIAFAQGRGKEAPPLLLTAARRLEQLDVVLARETYLEAVAAVIFAGHLARSPGWREIGEAARGAPPPRLQRATDKLLDALAVRLTDGFAASAPDIQRVLTAFCDEDVPVQESMVEGVRTVSAAIGSNQPPFGALALAAVRGHEREARTLIDATISEATQHGQRLGVTVAHFHHAVLCNGLGHYEQALTAAQAAARHQEEFGAPQWALAELVEAAARSGASEPASGALEQLAEATQASGTDWALGVEARSRALLSEGAAAETLYREAIERLSQTRVRVNLARAHLVYGEWLGRENRRVDARTQLEIAHEMLSQFGADAFAERARRALRAIGAKVRRRTVATSTALSAQEAQIARLAGDGLTNTDIGARLFLSPHTVDWHLRKVYSKLGIASRREIPTVLPQGAATSA